MPARDHPSFRQARNPNATIWRYTRYDKVVSMLLTKSLCFCRTDKFADPLEGRYTNMNPYTEDVWIAHQIANGGFGATAGSVGKLREGYRKMLSVVHAD